MTKLILVRHGQTIDNVNQIMQGQTQGELTDEGIRQAQELAETLKDETIDAFISSDLKRSVDTCELIASRRGRQVFQTALLRERDWGSFTGRYIPDLKDEPWTDDIETIEQMKQRAKDFLDYVRHNFPDKTVLAVGHGIINKAIQAVYYNKTMPEIPRMENGERRVLMLF